MAFTHATLEELLAWCASAPELRGARDEATARFVGMDDERPVSYLEGTGTLPSLQRRLMGYFMFNWRLPSGELPAEVGVKRLWEADRSLLKAIARVRFVLASVHTVQGRNVGLAVKDERFAVHFHAWSVPPRLGATMVAYLVPVSRGRWLAGPGWSELPIQLGPEMQAHLDQIQPTPVEWERFLQSRSSLSGEDIPDPQDEGLEAAVSRLTNWALDNRFPELIMSPARWEDRVVKWMPDNDIDAYLQETINLLPHPPSMQQAQGLLPLLSNIWNTTPQPDRGGLTANELLRVSRIRRR